LQPYLDSPLPGSSQRINSLVTQYRETYDPKEADLLLAQLQRQAAQDLTVVPISQGDEHELAAKTADVAQTSFGPGWQLGFFGMGTT
jgi:peptide/nickel transport system substrate-binding protein